MAIVIPNAVFLLGATEMSQCPKYELPEIAFIGRSNVGKSSMINSIVMRKQLAFTSSAPGKTREINFFAVDDKWILVDMPGLGYATIGKQHREKWEKVNYEYLTKRENLKLVCVLVDSRHDPQKYDLALIEYLENIGKNYLLVMTKCDKLSAQAVVERKAQLDALVSQCQFCSEVLPYSSVSGLGRNELVGIIKKYTL